MDLTIVSGGQTGVDRAALDFAIDHGLSHGGWCPRGRGAEDGAIDLRYQLRETESQGYAQRTQWNVRDSDATVVFSQRLETTGGTKLTLDIARGLRSPLLHLSRQPIETNQQQRQATCAAALRGFLDTYSIRKLNVAGPRESQAPGLGVFVYNVLQAALIECTTP